MKNNGVQWRIHIGAHKTATTHFQDIAESQRKKLLSKGIDFIPREQIRSAKVLSSLGVFKWRQNLQGKPLLNAFDKRVAVLRRGPSTVAISEENFLGSSVNLLASSFYSPFSPHMKTLSQLSQRDNVSLFLSIRNIVSLLPSAYAQAIRRDPIRNGFAGIKEQVINQPPSWLTLIRRILKLLPDAQLSVWSIDDYLNNKQDILSHFFGVYFPDFADIEVPRETKAPSTEAINEIEGLSHKLSKHEYRAKVSSIICEDNGKTKFSPFNKNEREMLFESYQEDLIRIEKEFPGMLFTDKGF